MNTKCLDQITTLRRRKKIMKMEKFLHIFCFTNVHNSIMIRFSELTGTCTISPQTCLHTKLRDFVSSYSTQETRNSDKLRKSHPLPCVCCATLIVWQSFDFNLFFHNQTCKKSTKNLKFCL